MIVTVKKLRKDNWSGKFNYRDTNSTKIGIGMKSSGELAIPFTKEQLKEWEEELGYAEGYLAKHSVFWKEYYVALKANTTFDTNIPQHRFDLEVIKSSKKVAKNYSEVNVNSYAEFVIHDEEQVAKVTNISRKNIKKAYALLDALSIDDMKKVLLQYGIKPFELSNEVVEAKLGDLLESDPNRFVKIASDDKLELKNNILTAVHLGIVDYRGQVYSYGTTSFGELEEAVRMLSEKEYAETLASILKQIKAKQNKEI